MNTGIKLESLFVDELVAHPENRDIDNGVDMGELIESVREHGVLQPLIVRDVEGKFYQILAGHRRCNAAAMAGIDKVPCLVRECTDEEAVAILMIENFERKQLDMMEEAEGMDALMRVCGYTAEDVARKISRSTDYVQTSLKFLDLGKDARKLAKTGAVKRETLSIAVNVDDEDRERAVQLCLFPGAKTEPLTPLQAKQMVKSEIVEPRKKEKSWNAAREKNEKHEKKIWKDSGLVVQVLPYAETMEKVTTVKTWVRASELIPASSLMPDVSELTTWGSLAAAHGLAGYYLPILSEAQADVYVDQSLCRAGEEAKHQHGMDTFLVIGSGVKKDQRVAEIERELDGEFGDDDDDGNDDAPPEERSVRRDSGSMILVSRDRLERVKGLCEKMHEPGVMEAGEYEEFPKCVREVAGYKVDPIDLAVSLIDWVLRECPVEED